MSKILITGGAGFIGSHLSEKLISQGHEVVVYDDLSTGSIKNLNKDYIESKKINFVFGNILKSKDVNPFIRDADFVYHLASSVGVKNIMKYPIKSMWNNIHGTENVIKACCRFEKPVFISSTSEVYGKSEFLPLREDGDSVFGPTTNKRWNYAYSKAIDEFFALAYREEYGLEVYIARFFNTVGPRQVSTYGMVVPNFVEKALRNEPISIYGDGKQTRCFCHVDDVCNAIVKIQKPECVGEIINFGGTEEISILELAETVIRILNSSSDIIFQEYKSAYGVGFEDMRRRIPDVSKAKKFLGFEQTKNTENIILDIASYINGGRV